METLRTDDLRSVLRFLDDAWQAAGADPFPQSTLEALQCLVPCDTVTYCELDRVGRRELSSVTTDPGEDGPEDVFWSIVDEHPLCRHQQAYGDFSAMRLSDVIGWSRLRHSRVYAEWLAPLGINAELEIGISSSPVRTRNFILDRSCGDFSERDRAVLNMVRPHLARVRELAVLRAAAGATETKSDEPLTAREAEILELVAEGLTNARIAERLWIAPGTVKKHLDNVYEKLGVSSRAAAAARVSVRRARAG